MPIKLYLIIWNIKVKIDKKVLSRRGIDTLSSKILDTIFHIFPKYITITKLSKKIDIRESTIESCIKKMMKNGVPIEINITDKKDREIRASLQEPISWIIKERDSAEVMLDIIGDMKMNGDENLNEQKSILFRIYEEYVQGLNEMFDKWNSLKLFDQLNEMKMDSNG